MRLGIDIGGTKTAALVLDDSGGVVAQVAAPSGRPGRLPRDDRLWHRAAPAVARLDGRPLPGRLAGDRVELEAALAADIDSRAQASPFLRRLDLVSRMRVLDGDVPVAAIGAAFLGGAEPAGAQPVGTVL